MTTAIIGIVGNLILIFVFSVNRRTISTFHRYCYLFIAPLAPVSKKDQNKSPLAGQEKHWHPLRHGSPLAYKDKKLVSLKISTDPSYIWSTDSKTMLI